MGVKDQVGIVLVLGGVLIALVTFPNLVFTLDVRTTIKLELIIRNEQSKPSYN